MAEALLTCEAAEAAAVARRQFMENGAIVADLVERLRIKRPAFVATCARGSSDHAATYGKYLIERALGLPVASLGPSLASVYGGGSTSPARCSSPSRNPGAVPMPCC